MIDAIVAFAMTAAGFLIGYGIVVYIETKDK